MITDYSSQQSCDEKSYCSSNNSHYEKESVCIFSNYERTARCEVTENYGVLNDNGRKRKVRLTSKAQSFFNDINAKAFLQRCENNNSHKMTDLNLHEKEHKKRDSNSLIVDVGKRYSSIDQLPLSWEIPSNAFHLLSPEGRYYEGCDSSGSEPESIECQEKVEAWLEKIESKPAKDLDGSEICSSEIEKAVEEQLRTLPSHVSESVSWDELERLSRDALSYATDPARCREVLESKIKQLQLMFKKSHPSLPSSLKKIKHDCTRPTLDDNDLTRIRELCPPDNYRPPSSELNDIKIISRAKDSLIPPDIITLRCITNQSISQYGRCYNFNGDYMDTNYSSYLPIPSIWTPRHALMNIAPCISSPGFFNISRPTVAPAVLDSDSDEEKAIY